MLRTQEQSELLSPERSLDGAVTENSETTSSFPVPILEIIGGLAERQQVTYVASLLQHDEMTALEVITPVFRQARTFASVFRIYKPIVLLLHEHFCRPGRKEAGKITWSQIVQTHFGVSLRRMQQLLAMPRNGPEDDPERKRRTEKQLDQILITALRLAHALLALDEDDPKDPSGDLRRAALVALCD